MALLQLDTQGFRNLQGGAVDTHAPCLFFVGENGQGKTNLLDALYTACYGSSFRGGQDVEAASLGQKAWRLRLTTGPLSDTTASFNDTLEVSWKQGTKQIRENDKAVSDRKLLVAKYPLIVFSHDDMEFVYGEPERRRFFFDQTAGLTDPSYIDALRAYRKVLKMRNQALKERSLRLVDVLDSQLIEYGCALQTVRQGLVERFNQGFSLCFEAIAQLGTEVRIAYRPSWTDLDQERIALSLEQARERELLLGTTMSGPHRDRYQYRDGQGDFSLRASTGQRRLLSLVLRVAQARHTLLTGGKAPILLLDDVLLELDPEKRRRFMDELPEVEQSFFTFLPGEPYQDYLRTDTVIYWTQDGRFSRT